MRRRSKFSELVPNPFAERSCNKIYSNQINFQVATQQCGGKFEILELSRTAPPSGSLTQTVSNYHAIAL